MELIPIMAGVGVGGLAARLLFGVFFEDAGDFFECLRYSVTPDILSLFRGEYTRDVAGSFRLTLWVVFSAGSGVLAEHFLSRLLS